MLHCTNPPPGRFAADWRDGQETAPVLEGFAAVIEVWEILFYLTEVFELSARL